MARKLRLQFEGAIYHVTVRGNGRRSIFFDNSDRERLLKRLQESKDTYQARIFLYCLMGNHFHLLVETPLANISRFMQSVLTGYTVYFNLKHHRSGHLVQGRYGAVLVDGDEYLRRLSRYIHLNPVRTRQLRSESLATMRQCLRSYRWSSYHAYITPKYDGELVDRGPILAMEGRGVRAQVANYRRYVEAGLAADDEEFEALVKNSQRAIGDNGFLEWVDREYEKLKESMGSREDVSFRREVGRVPPGQILSIVAREFGESVEKLETQRYRSRARSVAARMLCKHAGLTQRQAAGVLGFGTSGPVSRQLRRLAEELADDTALARHVSRIEEAIKAGETSTPRKGKGKV